MRSTIRLLATAAAVAISPLVHAETPLAVGYVRTFTASGWSYQCIGGEWDIGRCKAVRKIGKAVIGIKINTEGINVTATGKCVGLPLERRQDLDLEVLTAGSTVDDLARLSVVIVRSLPPRCKAKLTPEIQDSLRSALTFLIDFADRA